MEGSFCIRALSSRAVTEFVPSLPSSVEHYKKSFDPWRNSHNVFLFRHRSHCIHDKQSDFVIDSQCWIWSPIWSLNTMTFCQLRHRFRHRSHYFHDNRQISSWISSVGYESPIWSPSTMTLRPFHHNPTHIAFQLFLMINKFTKSYNVWKEL
jgi:hypothetical protein